MSYDYSSYASGNDNNQNNSGSSSGSSSGNDSMNLTMAPHAAIEGDLTKVFGNANSFGQSLGLVWENIELVDGCLYYDPDKDKYKVFPWKDVVGVSPDEGDVDSDMANQYLVKTYGTTEKRYELEAAVVPGDDEPVEIGDGIMWYSGSPDYGPKSAAKTLAKILTEKGHDMVIPEDESTADKYIKGWLADTSGQNITRDDLDGRRFAFFEVKRQSDQSDRMYHHPIVIDTKTDTKVTMQNNTEQGGETEGTLSGEKGGNDEDSEGDVPEPIADFVSTCDSLGFDDRDRAATLLGDLIADDGNDLTAEMIEDYGGEDAVLDEVAE